MCTYFGSKTINKHDMFGDQDESNKNVFPLNLVHEPDRIILVVSRLPVWCWRYSVQIYSTFSQLKNIYGCTLCFDQNSPKNKSIQNDSKNNF